MNRKRLFHLPTCAIRRAILLNKSCLYKDQVVNNVSISKPLPLFLVLQTCPWPERKSCLSNIFTVMKKHETRGLIQNFQGKGYI